VIMMKVSKAALPTVPIGEFTIPRHVAIIMDGNGRWASARGLPRGEGHRRGVEALRRTVRAAGDLGIGILTIFSFSAENWSRPPSEIRELMGLLRRFIRNDLADLHRNGVKVRVIGERGAAVLDEPVSSVMTRKVVCCRPIDTVAAIMEKMTAGKFRHLPVLEGGELVGLISIGDVVKWRVKEFENEQEALQNYIKTA